MKHLFSMLMIGLICAGLSGCNGKTGSGSSATLDKDTSYALGMSMGADFMQGNLIPDIDEFAQGMKDVLYGSQTRYTIDNAMQIVQQAFSALMEQQDAENRQAENDFLAENSRKPGIHVTSSGLQYEVVSEGTGSKPSVQDTVLVHYEGTFSNGMVFDSSYSRGEPTEFPLMGVIPGWSEGLLLMSVGSNYRFYIPSDLGYGPNGVPNFIPPYSTLIFEVELLDIINNQSEEP